MKRPLLALSPTLLLLLPACAPEESDPLDGEDDTFVSDGKTDSGIPEGSDEACAVLKLASLADLETIDEDAAVHRWAAENIVAYRRGPDGQAGTEDDEWFNSLVELDSVRWVGKQTFDRLLAYATEEQQWACGEVPVQLLAFNDFHGNLQPPAGSGGRIVTGPDPNVNRVDAGGAEYMATHIAALAAQQPNTLVVSAGDIIGATPLLSALFHDEPTIESMNAMGLDIAGVGNHEFDEGPEELLRMQYGGCHPVDGCQDGDDFAGADFGYLAANVVDESTGDTLFPQFTIRRFGHASVAFIGMTLEGTPLVTVPSGVDGLRFLDEADTVNRLVPVLEARGVNAIVLLIHEGGAATGLYNECVGISGPIFDIVSRLDPEVDVVVSGHTNAAHICDLDGTLVTSAASAGRLITDIDLVIDERTGQVVSQSGRNVIVTRDVAKEAAQTALIAKYQAVAAPLANRVVASISADLTKTGNAAGESAMGDTIADSQLEATRGQGAVAAFMNPGGVRADLLYAMSSGGEAAGQVTYGELFTVQPFGNTLVTMTVTGAQIELMLEQQWSVINGTEKANLLQVSRGFSYTWSSAGPLGDRIDPATIRIDGVVVDPAASYRITVNVFLADGGDGFAVLKEGTDRVGGGLDLDALEAYLAARSPYAPPALDRVTRL